MIETMLTISLILFATTIAIAVIRIVLGPSMPDRVIALDMIGVNLIAMIAVVSIILKTKAFLEVILILGILSFIGTIAFSKFIERGLSLSVNEIGEFAGALLILTGGIASVISVFGLIRLPDVYTRSHAATKSSTLAVLLTLSGTFLYFWFSENFISVRVLLGIVFVFLTAPVAGHLIIRAAYRSKVKLADISVEDELYEVLHKEKVEEDGTNR